jgi:hypothetical protein
MQNHYPAREQEHYAAAERDQRGGRASMSGPSTGKTLRHCQADGCTVELFDEAGLSTLGGWDATAEHYRTAHGWEI